MEAYFIEATCLLVFVLAAFQTARIISTERDQLEEDKA